MVGYASLSPMSKSQKFTPAKGRRLLCLRNARERANKKQGPKLISELEKRPFSVSSSLSRAVWAFMVIVI